jgi:hypothetical protein
MIKLINIELTNEEVLVLWNLLYRINNSDILNNFFEDQAEQRVLWDLECILEKNTDKIFDRNYLSYLKEARDNIRDKE